ncbi:hypothetical protein M5E06_08950 [Azospirillum sp. A1-3]|uniref:hypothetical protein n=1 Tax=Azospirillum sp. A1-3 TaxID=185874 RepID=UPI002076DA7A|nr:hypothetical protein [Azospirillum sp. A1-3]MCM8734322.1 hypothetical protein [Azospirillum sp. A1-3]
MQDSKNINLVDYDISGAIERLSDENGKVSKENRKQMLEILRKITEKPYSDMYDSSFYFNAAARASSLDQHGLATKLADIAYEKHKTAVHSVRRIRLKIESGDFQASDEVRKLIVGLTLERPEIVLSEAWNIAEHTSKYYELIEWIEELIRSRPDGGVGENYIPSYTYVILGQLYLRWGVPGSIEKAEDCFRIALELHQKESPMASWYNDTIRDYVDNKKYLEIARGYRKKTE